MPCAIRAGLPQRIRKFWKNEVGLIPYPCDAILCPKSPGRAFKFRQFLCFSLKHVRSRPCAKVVCQIPEGSDCFGSQIPRVSPPPPLRENIDRYIISGKQGKHTKCQIQTGFLVMWLINAGVHVPLSFIQAQSSWKHFFTFRHGFYVYREKNQFLRKEARQVPNPLYGLLLLLCKTLTHIYCIDNRNSPDS